MMLMSSSKLVVLRLYNVTFGRSVLFSRILRKALVRILIDKRPQGKKYVASARFFTIDELD